MERRVSSRAQVDVPICALVDGFRHTCRAVDLSPTGMAVELPQALRERELSQVSPFEIYLGGRPLRARARPVWSREHVTGMRFVWMHDVDRLTIAEMIDDQRRLGHRLH